MSQLPYIERGLQGFREGERQQNVRDAPMRRAQSVQRIVPALSDIIPLTENTPIGFPVGMVTVQLTTVPGGGVVGPVELWLLQRSSPGQDVPFVILEDSKPYQFFFGGQYTNPAIRNNGPAPVQIILTFMEVAA